MSHVSPLSLLSPDGEDIAPLSQLMRQTLNLRLTDLFSSTCLFPNDLVEKLVCSPKNPLQAVTSPSFISLRAKDADAE